MALLAAGAGYYKWVRQPLNARISDEANMLVRLSGLQSPVTNRLDPRYVDADGDMIADAPIDPARQIDPPTLYFSYVAVEDPSHYQAAFADLMSHISRATGKPVQYFPATTTEEQLKALRDGKLQIMGANTGEVPEAVCVAGFVPVAALGDGNGSSRYEMQIVVPSDSPIRSVDDLRGHVLTLTDPASNSGYKAPLVLLKSDFGLLPGRDYGVRYSGGHDQSIKGLADGTYEAIAVASDILKRQISDGSIPAAKFRVIYTSESFPTAAIGYAYNLKPALAAKIKSALLDFDFKGTTLQKEFGASNQMRLVPVDYKNDWALIRRIDDAIGFSYQLK